MHGCTIASVPWYGVKSCRSPSPSPGSRRQQASTSRRFRYYQRRKIFPRPARAAGSVRRYTGEDVERLRFIKRAQSIGFTLAEIETLLKLRARRSCRATRELAATKLHDVDIRINELQQLRGELAGLVASCDSNAEDASCPMIERLTMPARPAI